MFTCTDGHLFSYDDYDQWCLVYINMIGYDYDCVKAGE